MPKKTSPTPEHLRAPEIKRRVGILMKAATAHGFEIGGVRLDPSGEITLLDKSTQVSESDADEKWLGR